MRLPSFSLTHAWLYHVPLVLGPPTIRTPISPRGRIEVRRVRIVGGVVPVHVAAINDEVAASGAEAQATRMYAAARPHLSHFRASASDSQRFE